MAVEDDVKEGSIPSLIVNSLESNPSGDVLSAEDLAWVDSCLIKDPEISDSNWNALKDALLEIIDSQPESLSYSAAMTESSPGGTSMEILPSSEEAETAEFPGRNDDDPSETFVTDPFLPSYNDSERVSEVFDSGLSSDLLPVEMEPLSEDIFKVWDLGLPAEEDELVKQLKKALVDASFQSTSSAFEASGAWNLKDDSLDNLIAAISDLSLSRKSP